MAQLLLNKLLQRQMSRKEFIVFSSISIASLFGITGIIKELISHAGTMSTSLEAESGTLNNVSIVNDSSASGGAAVRFGSALSSITISTGTPSAGA